MVPSVTASRELLALQGDDCELPQLREDGHHLWLPLLPRHRCRLAGAALSWRLIVGRHLVRCFILQLLQRHIHLLP